MYMRLKETAYGCLYYRGGMNFSYRIASYDSETLVVYTALKYHQWKNTKFGNDQNEASVKPMDIW